MWNVLTPVLKQIGITVATVTLSFTAMRAVNHYWDRYEGKLPKSKNSISPGAAKQLGGMVQDEAKRRDWEARVTKVTNDLVADKTKADLFAAAKNAKVKVAKSANKTTIARALVVHQHPFEA